MWHENIFNNSPTESLQHNNGDFGESYTTVFELIKSGGYNHIGLIGGGDSWEYPFWYANKDNPNFTLQSILPNNESRSIAETKIFANIVPDVVVSSNEYASDSLMNYRDKTYRLVYREVPLKMYILENK